MAWPTLSSTCVEEYGRHLKVRGPARVHGGVALEVRERLWQEILVPQTEDEAGMVPEEAVGDVQQVGAVGVVDVGCGEAGLAREDVVPDVLGQLPFGMLQQILFGGEQKVGKPGRSGVTRQEEEQRGVELEPIGDDGDELPDHVEELDEDGGGLAQQLSLGDVGARIIEGRGLDVGTELKANAAKLAEDEAAEAP